MLNDDVIDGIMLEEKKEVDKVIISSQELSQYFGKDKTPREMKDTIIKLLDKWKKKQPELAKTKKKEEQECALCQTFHYSLHCPFAGDMWKISIFVFFL